MSREISLPDGDAGQPGWLRFNGFCFPILPQMKYQADGPDKKNPDRLFIEDRSGRFLLYFEAGMTLPERIHGLPADYGWMQVPSEQKDVTLYYPLQKEKPEVTVGYFSIRFSQHPTQKQCCGNLSIRLPMPYCIGLKEYGALHRLFRELCVSPREETDGREAPAVRTEQ